MAATIIAQMVEYRPYKSRAVGLKLKAGIRKLFVCHAFKKKSFVCHDIPLSVSGTCVIVMQKWGLLVPTNIAD